MGATQSFEELFHEQDKPVARNLEFTHFLSPQFQWALRLEGSQENIDEPERQIGTALTTRAVPAMNITYEYVHGTYRQGLAENDKDYTYQHIDHVDALLSIAF